MARDSARPARKWPHSARMGPTRTRGPEQPWDCAAARARLSESLAREEAEPGPPRGSAGTRAVTSRQPPSIAAA